jgi:sugar lactone lactonase YvrE
MFNFHNGKNLGARAYLSCLASFVMVLVLTVTISAANAQTQLPEWYRLRTNSVPYQPQNLALDSSGGLWVSAQDGSEYDPGVWYRPAGSSAAPSFQHISNNQRNNLVGAGYNPPIVKPQLTTTVLFSVNDKGGNTWYALKNRTVLCEKRDGTWLTFSMPDSSSLQPGTDTTNVDSAFRIRLIDKPGGTQEVLLIANRGVVRVDAALAVVETRPVSQPYNNYFIRDALIDSQGRFWLTSEMGVEKGTSLFSTTYIKTLFPADPNAASGTMITRIVEDTSGNIWFGSNSYSADGIYSYTIGGLWNKYTGIPVSTVGLKVNDIAAGSDGSVWFGAVHYSSTDLATGGILRYLPTTSGGQWKQFTQADLGLESGNVHSLASDGTALWFATAYNPAISGNGTGVHYLTLNTQGTPNVTHYSYRSSSTTLSNLRYNAIAADKSGGVWFPSYDDPSIARLKADGSWQQFRQVGTGSLGSFGIAGVAADSANKVYFAPLRSAPLGYDVTTEQWLTLPAAPFSDFYYYGVYADAQDGKWFYGPYGVYYLNPANTAWTSFSPAELPGFPATYFINSVLVDDAGNAWFMCRSEVVLMKKAPAGGDPTWFRFTGGSLGYTGGYLVYQDDTGQVWNAAKQKFDSVNNVWTSVTDTSAFDNRKLRFLNGTVPATMSLTGSLAPISTLDENTMTLDSRGAIYFSGGMIGLSSVNVGIVAFGPLVKENVTVTVNAGGTGAGSVSSSPAGISYRYSTANSGTAPFAYGAHVVLTATADTGSSASWNDCTANGGIAGGTTLSATCTFNTLLASKTITATFALRERYNIYVTITGNGAGTVTSSAATTGVPNDINCSSLTCSAGYPIGSAVSLSAVPGSISTFDGWSALCSANPCSLTLDTDKSVTATFSRAPLAKNMTTNTPYSSLTDALLYAQPSEVIGMLDTQLDGHVSVSRAIALQGGWSATYQSKSGVPTTLNGNVTFLAGDSTGGTLVVKGLLAVKGGSLRVDGVRVKN